MFAFLLATTSLGYAADDKHEHPEIGPHKGELIELGDEEYHAEFVHDEDKNTVTVFILDAAAKESVPIEAKEVVINLKQKGKPRQFKIKALPHASDPKGLCSRFAAMDKDLCEQLEVESAAPRIQVTIKGKAYSGKIAHHHDHEKK
jgi:hypothetical protein